MAELINPLVAQYLSGLGADLMKYGGNTNNGLQLENVNAITNQSIKNNSMLKLMQHALGPDGSSVKVGADGVNIKITPDSEMFKNLTDGTGIKATPESAAAPAASTMPATPTSTPTPQPAATPTGVVNPFSIVPPAITNPFAGIKAGDLAGMDSATLAGIGNMAMTMQQLKQKSYSELVDAASKAALMPGTIAHTAAQTKLANVQADAHAATEPVVVNGSKMLVTKQQAIELAKLNELPPEAKVYNFAKSAEGGGFKGSFDEWKNSTGHMKDYKKVLESPAYGKWLEKMATAGAVKVSLDTKLEEKKAMGGLAGQLYFKDPKWTTELDKHINTFKEDDLWTVKNEKDRPLAIAKEKVSFIEGKITAGGGAIQTVNLEKDGKTMVWTVKWPSGDTETIKQAVK